MLVHVTDPSTSTTTTVAGEDIIADYDADSMSILSISVEGTFAKKFTGDAWTVKPSLGLTLTGNFGDAKTESTVHWGGVESSVPKCPLGWSTTSPMVQP